MNGDQAAADRNEDRKLTAESLGRKNNDVSSEKNLVV